jgi:hypothetical protein
MECAALSFTAPGTLQAVGHRQAAINSVINTVEVLGLKLQFLPRLQLFTIH